MHRGDIWLINLDPTVGAEIRKSRPAVIVSVDEIGILPLRVIVPLTDWKEHYARAPWMVRVTPSQENRLDKPSAADAFQVRSISTQRFIQKIGVLEAKTLEEVILGIQVVFGGE
jgi:mRNA interferase MazF